MRILAMSDIHDNYEAFAPEHLPTADLCIVAGDLTNYGVRGRWRLSAGDRLLLLKAGQTEAEAGAWNVDEVTRAEIWLRKLTAKMPVLWIPGNHDIGLNNTTFAHISNCTGILDRTVEINGLRIHGVSMAPCYNFPALASQWDYMTADPDVEQRAYAFEPVDIVVSHAPPFGILDRSPALPAHTHGMGSPALLRYIEANSPTLVFCGHIHEGAGYQRYEHTDVYNLAGRRIVVER